MEFLIFGLADSTLDQLGQYLADENWHFDHDWDDGLTLELSRGDEFLTCHIDAAGRYRRIPRSAPEGVKLLVPFLARLVPLYLQSTVTPCSSD